MEHWKGSRLLTDLIIAKIVTRKWIEENDLSNGQFPLTKNMRFKTPMLRSDLCNYSDDYIVVKGYVQYPFASLAFKAKREYLWNLQKC